MCNTIPDIQDSQGTLKHNTNALQEGKVKEKLNNLTREDKKEKNLMNK